MKGAVLLEVRNLKTRVWAGVLEEQYRKKTRGLAGALVEQSTQTLMKMKPDSVAGQEEPDTSPSALYYAAGLGASCSKGYSSSGYVDLSRMTALKSCHRPLSCP
jgi:hypothetical protein